MATKLKDEFQKFLKDIDENITDKKDLEYIRTRSVDLFGAIVSEMEKIMDWKEDKITEIENKLAKMEALLDNIERDIYDEEGFDFEIVCPYCNAEFIIDVEDKSEIKCPECHNIIELDWNGDFDEDESGCSHGSCSSCPGCGSMEEFEDDNEEDDDDM